MENVTLDVILIRYRTETAEEIFKCLMLALGFQCYTIATSYDNSVKK